MCSSDLDRSNAQSRVLEEALIRAGMPYRIYGGQRFYDRLEIKNALAYLRLISNRDDDTAMERVINVPTRGIGGKTIEEVRLHARTEGVSRWGAANEVVELNKVSARAANALQAFIDLVNQIAQETEDTDLHEQTEHAIKKSGLIEHHLKEKGEKAQARVENLEELISAARQYLSTWQPDKEGNENSTPLTAFMYDAALDAGEAQADEHQDSVQLMTLHSAKGLEFPLVFLAGMEEGLFPHKMSIEEPGRLEEERRLCYVGITRAMQKLFITYAESRRLHGNETFNRPSRFIREIPENCLEEVRLNASVSRPVTARQPQRPSMFDNAEVPDTQIVLGQRVSHQIFGDGIVVNYEGSGPKARVQVNFDSEGSKWLVVGYANLQPA